MSIIKPSSSLLNVDALFGVLKSKYVVVYFFSGAMITQEQMNALRTKNHDITIKNIVKEFGLTVEKNLASFLAERRYHCDVNPNHEANFEIAGDPSEVIIHKNGKADFAILVTSDYRHTFPEMVAINDYDESIDRLAILSVGDFGSNADIEILDGMFNENNTYKLNSINVTYPVL